MHENKVVWALPVERECLAAVHFTERLRPCLYRVHVTKQLACFVVWHDSEAGSEYYVKCTTAKHSPSTGSMKCSEGSGSCCLPENMPEGCNTQLENTMFWLHRGLELLHSCKPDAMKWTKAWQLHNSHKSMLG